MPKQFVPGTKVQALCKSIFGEKEARRVHATAWKTAVVYGVILPGSGPGRKVRVQWDDSINNLHSISEHGVQTFITDNSHHVADAGNAQNMQPNTQVAPAGASTSQNSSNPAQPQSPALNQSLFSHPASRPRFQPLVPRSMAQAQPNPAPEAPGAEDSAQSVPQSTGAVEQGPSESDDNYSDRAEDDGCVNEDVVEEEGPP